MKKEIFCKTTSKGIHSFYMTFGNETYFLFNQNYRRGVNQFFKNGIYYDDAIKRSKAHHDKAIIRTMEKLPVYVEYAEKEHGIEVLNKTKKRDHRRHLRSSYERIEAFCI